MRNHLFYFKERYPDIDQNLLEKFEKIEKVHYTLKDFPQFLPYHFIYSKLTNQKNLINYPPLKLKMYNDRWEKLEKQIKN